MVNRTSSLYERAVHTMASTSKRLGRDERAKCHRSFFMNETLRRRTVFGLTSQQLVPGLQLAHTEIQRYRLFVISTWLLLLITKLQVRNYLSTTFPNRWQDGRRRAIEWPSRSPNLFSLRVFKNESLQWKAWIPRCVEKQNATKEKSLRMEICANKFFL